MTGHSTPLAIYAEEVFLPDLTSVSDDARREYRKAVRRFIGWAGCDVMIHQVTEGLIERFCRSIIIEGATLKTARGYRACIRRIVRHRFPDQCLKASGRRPNEKNPVTIAGMKEAEHIQIEGSLLKFAMDDYVQRRMLGASATSVNQVRHAVMRFSRFLGRCAMLTDLNESSVISYLQWVIGPAGLSKATANHSRSYILMLWRHAFKRNAVNIPPADVPRLKAPKRLPQAWTLEEMGKILNAAGRQQYPKTGMTFPPGKFYPAMILVAYDTGLRLRALLGLRREDWNPERLEIVAPAEIQKQNVSQVYQVSEQTRDALQTMLDACRDDQMPELLFPWPVRREQVFEALKRILKDAGIKHDATNKNGLWHQIRRTCATHLAAAIGLEGACRQLGHSSVEMTRRYVDPRMTNQHAAAVHLPRPK